MAKIIKNLLANTGDLGLTSGLGRFPGERNGYHPTPVFLLENSMDGGPARVDEVTKDWT